MWPYAFTIVCLTACAGHAAPYKKGEPIRLKDCVGREWRNELIHYELEFRRGDFPQRQARLIDANGREAPVQLTEVATYKDGSLKKAVVSLVASLKPNEVKEWKLLPGPCTAAGDLEVKRAGDALEVTTSLTGARFHLGEKRFDPPAPAERVPAYLQAIRLRSGKWAGRGWFETPHKCRRYRVHVLERGPVYVTVAFEYVFDGFRRAQDSDVYRGTVRIAQGQELIEIDEEFALGDPNTYSFIQFKDRAEEILWDWWQWMPHDARHNFCFSIYDGLRPTRARWFGHNATIPEKRMGRNPGMDHETDYRLDFRQDRFDLSVNAYLRGCPDQCKSYLVWRDADPNSDALGIIGIRAVDWIHPDVSPKKLKIIKQATDTADLRIYACKKPDLVVKAPLHLGRRAWGILTLKMPEAAPADEVGANGKVVKYGFMKGASQCLRLQAKYGTRQLEKIKDWVLEWESKKAHPSLFIKAGGIDAIRLRILASPALWKQARRQRHKAIIRYLLDGGQKNAQAAYEDLVRWCNRHIDIFFMHGYGSHLGTNNNQFPWWMQEMSARYDLVMGMPELRAEQKERLKSLFAFCVHMLQDDEFMPPRRCGYGWGSLNMPINTRGGRAVTAAVLADNPDAKAWLDRAVEYLDVFITRTFSPDGVPRSGPHYTSTQADPLINMALPLYYTGAVGPIQRKFPRIARFTRFLIDRMTPPDIRCRNNRILPTIGHTRLEYDSDIGKYAVLMALTDRKLAGEALWMWHRGGTSTSGFMDGVYHMHEDLEAVQPKLASCVYPGFGAVLRNGFPHPNETYMIIHHGNHSVDHYDHDVGSFHLYAKGVPLCLDFSSMYQPNCCQSLWHNTISWNVKEHAPRKPAYPRGDPRDFYTGKIWYDHKYDPHTLLDFAVDSQSEKGWEEYLGTTKAHAFSPEVDYVMTASILREFERHPFYNKQEGKPAPWAPFTEFDRVRLRRSCEWQRRFVFVKDEDLNGPNYFLIQDDFDGQDELTPQMNIWCLAATQEMGGGRVYWKGQYHVDLDLYVAWPKGAKITSRTWWHGERGPAGPRQEDWKERQIAAHVENKPGDGGFAVVLYPRGRYEVKPRFGSTKDGTAVKVVIGDRTDVIFASRKERDWKYAGVRCKGTVAVVKQHPEYTAAILCEPGSLQVRDLSLAAAMPIAIRLAETEVAGVAMGEGEARLELPKGLGGKRIRVAGKDVGKVAAEGKVKLSFPPGRTAIQIR